MTRRACFPRLLLAGCVLVGSACGLGDESFGACGEFEDLLVSSRYVSSRPGSGGGGDAGEMEVHVLYPDGSAGAVVTDLELVASDPSLNPAGTQVVFVDALGDYESAGPESTSLSVIGLDGQGYYRVTGESAAAGEVGPNPYQVLDEDPDWSSTRDEIVFTRIDGRDSIWGSEVWIVPSAANGGAATRLVAAVGGYEPAFSPDGKRVAFVSGDGPSEAIWVVDRDGSNAREVASLPGTDGQHRDVTWAPDGQRLYAGGSGEEGEALVAVDLPSGEVTEVAPNGVDLVWVSPERLYSHTRDLDARRPGRIDWYDSMESTTSTGTIPIDPSDPGPWRLTELRLEDGEIASVERVGPSDYHIGLNGLDAVSCAS